MAAALAAVLAAGTVGAAAAARHVPDLTLSTLSPPPAYAVPGTGFTERFVERNLGSRRAPASITGFYLSSTAHIGPSAVHLVGLARVKALPARKKRSGSAKLTLPSSVAAGSYFLIGCADDAHRLKERNEHNNCRAASGRVTVGGGSSSKNTSATGNTGTSSATGPGSAVTACVPSAGPDKPDMSFKDSNCDGIDGEISHAVFVSGLGDDLNPGTMAAPKRTLTAAVQTALAEKRMCM